jgi:hypothetical protein
MFFAAQSSELPPADAIRQAAKEVVARPYYRLGLDGDADGEPLILRILRWIFKPFRWLFDSMEGLPDLLRWAIVIVCALACAAIISHIVYTLLMAIRGPSLGRGGTYDSPTREVDPTDLEQQADRISREGDHIGAIRLLFRAALRRIELAEKRKLRPGFTNRELLKRYRASPLQSPLARFVDTIDQKWYGNLPCEQADYSACRDEHGRIREFINQRETAHAT